MKNLELLKGACSELFGQIPPESKEFRFNSEEGTKIVRLLVESWDEFKAKGQLKFNAVQISQFGIGALEFYVTESRENFVGISVEVRNNLSSTTSLWAVDLCELTVECLEVARLTDRSKTFRRADRDWLNLNPFLQKTQNEAPEESAKFYDVDLFTDNLAKKIGSRALAERMVNLAQKYSFCIGLIRGDWRGLFDSVKEMKAFKRKHSIVVEFFKGAPIYNPLKVEAIFLKELNISREVAEAYDKLDCEYLDALNALRKSGSDTAEYQGLQISHICKPGIDAGSEEVLQ